MRVFIEMSDGVNAWGTIGVHANVIEASWEALEDGIILGPASGGGPETRRPHPMMAGYGDPWPSTEPVGYRRRE